MLESAPSQWDGVVANREGHRRMLDVVRDAFRASDRIDIAVSFLRCSGLGLVVDELKSFTARGGAVRLLTSTYMDVTQPEALRAIAEHPGITCRVHIAHRSLGESKGFHVKLYSFSGDTEQCWIGSSNFTKAGLSSNLEANLRHDGEREVGSIRVLFDHLWHRPEALPLTSGLIEWYSHTRQSPIFSVPLAARQSSSSLDPRIVAGFDNRWPAVLDSGKAEPVPLVSGARPNVAQAEALARLEALRECGV